MESAKILVLINQQLPTMVNCKHNKRFKTDSQRSAVLVLIGFSVYGAIFECCGSVAHHLSGRYAIHEISERNRNLCTTLASLYLMISQM